MAGDDALLVDPDDHEAIAKALARILDDPALAESLGRLLASHGTAWRGRYDRVVPVPLHTDRLRARQRRRSEALDDVPEPADGAASAVAGMIEADRMAALDAALASLPDRQREAVVLRHIEGMSNPEIAEILQIGVEAVESLTARGKRALAAILSGQRAALGYEEAE